MDPGVAATFTPVQRHALEMALSSSPHAVDLRWSVPWGRTRLYLVILVGADTRSVFRRRLEAAQRDWRVLNLLVVGGAMGLGVLALLGLAQLVRIDFAQLLAPTIAPAAIPFKPDPASCEHSGRIWQDGTCLDYTHDPTF